MSCDGVDRVSAAEMPMNAVFLRERVFFCYYLPKFSNLTSVIRETVYTELLTN